MELKQSNFSDTVSLLACLNRTFYGIETLATLGGVSRKGVLMDQLQFSVFAFYLY